MKIKIKNIKKFFNEEQQSIIEKFVSFLTEEVPLKKDIVLSFTDYRPYDMTTGVRVKPNMIYVLGRDRMLADILRTISHEWMHEFEHQKLGVSEKKRVQNIGGPNENLANIMMGILFKRFEKKYPEDKSIIYNED